MNFYAILTASIVPMFIGFVWYNPKTFGNIWMKEVGMTMEDAKGANMVKIFGFTYLFSLMAATAISTMVIHQIHVESIFKNIDGFGTPGTEITNYYDDFMARFGDNFRTFKHGAFHGALTSVFFILPIIGTNAMFERRSWKYIFIHVGYWFVSMIIMGGIISVWK
ncbi:MAG: DUF1761 domain-containing protein [Flavobacteriales bacterium]